MKKRMNRFLKLSRHGEKGFTLIELLVVVAILGILVAILIPNVISFIGEGESQARDESLNTVQLAVTAACTAVALDTSDSTPVFPLGPGSPQAGTITQAGSNITISDDTTLLNIGDYLIGGYPGIEEDITFYVSTEGLVSYDPIT